MGYDWQEGNLRRKYAELPEEGARYKKKAKKKNPKKANHKHVYKNCFIRYKIPRDQYFCGKKVEDAGDEAITLASYCPICGKIGWREDDEEFQKIFPQVRLYWMSLGNVPQEAMEWMHEHYPTFFVENYDTYRISGQVFIDKSQLDSVK